MNSETISKTERRAKSDAHGSQLLAEYIRRRDSGDITVRREAMPLEELKGQIARHYAGLVESIARRFSASGEPLEDLVQEGYLGLLTALERFDSAKNVKFSTYATHFVAGAMNHCLRDRGKIIKEPAWLHEICGKINRATALLEQNLGRQPHPSEIAGVLNLTEEAIEEILSTRQIFQVASFESDSGEGDMIGLVDPEKIRSDRYVTLQLPIEDRIVLENAVEHLKGLEQKVLHEFFYKDLNQTEIARSLDISCNYVSHILKNATKKLRSVIGEAEALDRNRHGENSVVDPISGLYTAAYMKNRLEEEVSRSARSARPLAVLVIEIDGLEQATGRRREEIWRYCGDAVRKSVRRMDIAGRYEGNSVLILLPETGAQADIVAERLLDTIRSIGAMMGESLSPRIGSAYYPAQGRQAVDLLTIARRGAGLSEIPLPVRAVKAMVGVRNVVHRENRLGESILVFSQIL